MLFVSGGLFSHHADSHHCLTTRTTTAVQHISILLSIFAELKWALMRTVAGVTQHQLTRRRRIKAAGDDGDDDDSWCLCDVGMLTVTDFIHILYKYYRSPEVCVICYI